MLQDIRNNAKGTAAKIIVGLIVISFALFGIESILLGGGGGGIAEVNGDEVSEAELQQAVATQTRRLISMMGENFDPAMLDEVRIKNQALDGLINRKIMLQAVEAMGLQVSEAEIGSQITGMEQFQVDGKFDPDLYKRALSDNGFTPSYFKQTLSGDMAVAQARSGLAGSEFATSTEVAISAAVVGEQRDFRYLTIPADVFRATQPPEAGAISEYYEAHKSEYQTEESVDVDYIELSLEDFFKPVPEQAIVDAYELAAQEFTEGIENRVSHILLTGDDETIERRLAAVQGKLASGEDFASLAEQYSDDIGSSTRGGDLGYSSGDAFPVEIETALVPLEQGIVSEPVYTDDGAHLLLVTERRETTPPTLDEMRLGLEQSIQRDEARAELLLTVETLRDVSFNAEDLTVPAQELELTVRQLEGVTRNTGSGHFANPVLRQTAFADDVLVEGHNSDVIELPGDKYVVLHVSKHHPAKVKPLEDVRDLIAQALVDQAASQAVAAEAGRVLKELRSGKSLESVANAAGYEWQVELGATREGAAATVSPSVLNRVFELPPPSQSTSIDFVVEQNTDAVVIELVEVAEGDFDEMPATEQAQLQRQVLGESGSLVDSQFQQGLREAAEIVVL